ncbi:uncharacterized protein LOC120139157 [Hibiscus syriacus]|uniref:uncharacterized protein LOC120139157 n=1 Tax=Hibiscus syriacus TaxID=106335 RepID=UPI001924A07E|nr:uncharacterized protein LOC120139157 [Hibiscus syriacus]
MIQFWNPAYSCFTFNREDMTPTLEEYHFLLNLPKVKVSQIYSQSIKGPLFKSKLAKISGTSDKWIKDRLQRRGESIGVPWLHLQKIAETHVDEDVRRDVCALGIYSLIIFPRCLGIVELAVVDLVEKLKRGTNPVHVILAETFRSLNMCRRFDGGRFMGCAQLLTIWIRSHFWKERKVNYNRFLKDYSPITEYLTKEWPEVSQKDQWVEFFRNLQVTHEVAGAKFDFKEANYKKKVKDVVDSWRLTFVTKVVRADVVLKPDYEAWRIQRVNDKIPLASGEGSRSMEEQIRNIPSNLEIQRSEFEIEKAKDTKKIKEMERENFMLTLEAEFHTKQFKMMRNKKEGVEANLEELKRDYQKMQQTKRGFGSSKAPHQWAIELAAVKRRIKSLETENKCQVKKIEASKAKIGELEADKRDLIKQSKVGARKI